MAFFSIIIPAYNAAKTIRSCLDSILAQTFSDYQIIIIDDGSEDSTLEIVKTYISSDSRISVLSFPNSGVGLSRDRGIALATGDYIIFVDADDSINPELLSQLHSRITAAKESLDIIRYQCNLVNDSPVKDSSRYNFMADFTSSGIDALQKWSIPGKKYAVYWLFCFKRLCFEEVAVPWYRCYEDVALIPFLIAKARYVCSIQYVGYNYTRGITTSLTNSISVEAERSRAIAFFKAYDFATRLFLELDVPTSVKTSLINDYNRRLLEKYNSLPNSLKDEFLSFKEERIGK